MHFTYKLIFDSTITLCIIRPDDKEPIHVNMNKIKHPLQFVIGTTLIVATLIGAAFGLRYGALAWKEYFKPRDANVEREAFLATRSFNEAKVQELSKYHLEYSRAVASGDTAGAGAIKATIQHTFAAYNPEKLPIHLRNFLVNEIYNY